MGTFAYMSPEQAKGQALDARTDLFSFGVVLYEMVSGAQAFPGRTTGEMLETLFMREPPSLENLNIERARKVTENYCKDITEGSELTVSKCSRFTE